MSEVKVGRIIEDHEQVDRDAIHVAILPVIAAEDLYRGKEVGFVYGSKTMVKHKDSVYGMKPIGIVDPFLGLPIDRADPSWVEEVRIKKGQRCYVFLFPNTVNGMRHHWQHPEIDDPIQEPKNEPELWLRKFADKWNFDYDEMVAAAQEKEGYVVAMGIDLHGASDLDPGDEQQFWRCIEVLTGCQYDSEHRENFSWSCSC